MGTEDMDLTAARLEDRSPAAASRRREEEAKIIATPRRGAIIRLADDGLLEFENWDFNFNGRVADESARLELMMAALYAFMLICSRRRVTSLSSPAGGSKRGAVRRSCQQYHR